MGFMDVIKRQKDLSPYETTSNSENSKVLIMIPCVIVLLIPRGFFMLQVLKRR